MAITRKRELEELLEQKQKEMAEIEAALQAEGEQGRETAEKTRMASSTLHFCLAPTNKLRLRPKAEVHRAHDGPIA